MKIERILVPTDFSEHAGEAVEYAVNLAKRASASLDVLHVCHLPNYLLLDASQAAASHAAGVILGVAQEQMDALEQELLATGLEIRTEVREGIVHEAINTYAREHAVDLIVQGTHGRGGVARAFFGSITERVLRTAGAPLVVVPKGMGSRIPATIIVAYDFSEPAKGVAHWGRAIHGVVHGAVHMAHSYIDVWGEYTDRGSVTGESALRRQEALRNGLTEMLEHDAQSLFSIDAQAVQTHLLSGDPVDKLLELAEEVGADLICAGTTGKTGIERLLIGSVAMRLLHKSPIPVLFAH